MNYLNAFSVLSCNHLSYHKSVHWLFCSKSLDMKVYIKKTKLLTTTNPTHKLYLTDCRLEKNP